MAARARGRSALLKADIAMIEVQKSCCKPVPVPKDT